MIFFRDMKGMVLITILLLTVLLILMTVSMIFISTNHLSIMGNIEAKEKALKAAEAVVSYAIYELNSNPAWGLSGDPIFKEGKFVDHTNPSGTYPEFSPDTSLYINNNYSDNYAFYITFDPNDPNSSQVSVNNLFGPIKDTDSGTPAYTAKIVSTGKFLSGDREKATKTIVAYLVRSDYSPYSINVAKKITFMEDGGEIAIYGRAITDPGCIYSGSKEPDSITAGSNADIKTSKGIFSARNTINLPVTFDGKKLEYLTQDYSFGKIDIDGIINNAKTGEYGTLSTVNPGQVSLVSNINWKMGHYFSYLNFNSSSGGFNSSVATIENGPGSARLKLKKDIYIQGTPSDELRIFGNPEIIEFQEHRFGYLAGDPPVPLSNFVNNGISLTYLDLNGHTIYSDCDLAFGIDVVGRGRIYSRGAVHYRIGVNTDEIITACKESLTVEVSKYTSVTSFNKGLYYSDSNITIQPIANNSDLLIEGEDECISDFVQRYAPFTRFTEPDNKLTTIGLYQDPDYTGNGLKITKWIDQSGDYKLVVEGDGGNRHLQICLDYAGRKNIDFDNYKVGVIPTATDLEVKLLNSNNIILSPQPNLSSLGITEEELDYFGIQAAEYFDNFSHSIDIHVTGTIAGLNSLGFSPGPGGNIKVNFYPDYIHSMVNIQRKFFTVRKISSYTI